MVFKAASEAPLVCVRLIELMMEAGVPAGIVNRVTGPESVAGPALVEHPDVDKITVTGSAEVARGIMRIGADTLRLVTLELGASQP